MGPASRPQQGVCRLSAPTGGGLPNPRVRAGVWLGGRPGGDRARLMKWGCGRAAHCGHTLQIMPSSSRPCPGHQACQAGMASPALIKFAGKRQPCLAPSPWGLSSGCLRQGRSVAVCLRGAGLSAYVHGSIPPFPSVFGRAWSPSPSGSQAGTMADTGNLPNPIRGCGRDTGSHRMWTTYTCLILTVSGMGIWPRHDTPSPGYV